MASMQHENKRLEPEDQKLVDLLRDVLVDPNLHTDTRLRLHREISEILRGAHVDPVAAAGIRRRMPQSGFSLRPPVCYAPIDG